jgi:RNA polymerase sigma-70 factor, ECF subfamily
VADAFREEWGRINAALIHQTGDWDLAEECAQDAFAQALRRWPDGGVPDRPGAWLMTVARNGAIDRLRRGRTYRAKVEEIAVMATRESGTDDADDSTTEDSDVVGDERLRLIFTCCLRPGPTSCGGLAVTTMLRSLMRRRRRWPGPVLSGGS